MSSLTEIPATGQEVVTTEQEGFLAMMERLALSNVDVGKLEKMMDLHERMLNRNAKADFAADYVRMKPHLPTIARRKHNTQTKSKYAPLEDINAEIDPILEQYGFGTATKIISQDEASVTVKAELWHRGGHVEETIINMPLDRAGIQGTVNKTGPHATSSSVTYAKRVAICALLNISTGDDVDGNRVESAIDTEKAAELDLLINSSGTQKATFLAMFGVEDVRHILSKDYDTAKRFLEMKKGAKKNG